MTYEADQAAEAAGLKEGDWTAPSDVSLYEEADQAAEAAGLKDIGVCSGIEGLLRQKQIRPQRRQD